jgi:phage-related protein
MAEPIDRLFVELDVANTRTFDRELNADVEETYAKVAKSTSKVTKKIAESFDAAGRKIERTFTNIEKDGVVTTKVLEKSFDDAGEKVRKTFKLISDSAVDSAKLVATVENLAAESVADDFEKAGERIEDAFREASRVARREARQIERAADKAADGIQSNFAAPVNKALAGVGSAIVSIGSALVGLGASAPTPAGLLAIALAIGAIAAAAAPAVALVGALADVIGVIAIAPAGIAVLAAAIAPLVISFNGLGDAIGAVIAKDPEKIAEAMKKLAPAARSVVKEFQKLLPQFEKLGDKVQQAFFKPLIGNLTLATKNLLPALSKGLSDVAGALGRAGSNFFDFLSETSTAKAFQDIFASTVRVIDSIAPGIQDLARSILDLAVAGLPTIEKLADGFGELLTKFATFLSTSVKDGSFQEFLDDALATIGELIDLGGALGRLFIAIFGDADDEGRDFIQTVTDMVNELADFFESAEGQQAIEDLLENLKTISLVLGGVADVIGFVLTTFSNFKKGVEDAAKATAQFVDDAVTFVSELASDVGERIDEIASFFAALPGKIWGFLSSIPGRLRAFWQGVFDGILITIGRGVGLILYAFQVLPGQILGFVQGLPAKVNQFFADLWNGAKQKTEEGVNALSVFVSSIPNRISQGLSSLKGTVSKFFKDALAAGQQIAVDGFNKIVSFVQSVPGRIRDAFKAGGGLVGNIAGDIASSLKTFLNRIIDKINVGIADIDDVLPGNLGRIPRLAKGGVIEPQPGGTLAVLGEAGEREIATPESLLRKILAETGNSGGNVTFGPGSVVVSFEGAVPSEMEAFRTGQAVGAGIAQAMTRQNIRAQVRTLGARNG